MFVLCCYWQHNKYNEYLKQTATETTARGTTAAAAATVATAETGTTTSSATVTNTKEADANILRLLHDFSNYCTTGTRLGALISAGFEVSAMANYNDPMALEEAGEKAGALKGNIRGNGRNLIRLEDDGDGYEDEHYHNDKDEVDSVRDEEGYYDEYDDDEDDENDGKDEVVGDNEQGELARNRHISKGNKDLYNDYNNDINNLPSMNSLYDGRVREQPLVSRHKRSKVRT